jgi:hypothetical protein
MQFPADDDLWFPSDLFSVDDMPHSSSTTSVPGDAAVPAAQMAGSGKRKCGAVSGQAGGASASATNGASVSAASASSSETPLKKRNRKQVTFAPGTKEHDGLCPPSARLVEFVADMFKKQQGPSDVVPSMCRERDLSSLLTLRRQMHDLVERCGALRSSEHAHVLMGGGSGVSAVTIMHLPFLTRHLQRLEDAIVQLRNSSA